MSAILPVFLQIVILDCKVFSISSNSNEEKTLVNRLKKFAIFLIFFLQPISRWPAKWSRFSGKQGNYSLRRPPKLIITKNIHWSKMGYRTQIHVSSNNCQKASPSCIQIWHLYVWPIYQHSTIIRVTVKKRHHLAPRFGTCMYDPYTSTQPS